MNTEFSFVLSDGDNSCAFRCFFNSKFRFRFLPRIFLVLRSGLNVGDSSSSSIIIRRLRSFGTLGVVGDIRPAIESIADIPDTGVAGNSVDETSILVILESSWFGSIVGDKMAGFGNSLMIHSFSLMSIAIGAVVEVIVIVPEAVKTVVCSTELTTLACCSVLCDGIGDVSSGVSNGNVAVVKSDPNGSSTFGKI